MVKIMAGLLARDSSSGRLPSLSTSGMMPFVLAYSGGPAGDLHPSSLSSPCGHLDPIFGFCTEMHWLDTTARP